MLRVKLVKDWKGNLKGSILVVDRNEAFGLIDSGKAVISKDMAEPDYKVTSLDEEQANGIPIIVRTNKRK